MKILFVSSSSGSKGGGEIYLLRLGFELRALGHEVALWASSHSRMDELCCHFKKAGPVFRSDYVNTYDRPLRGLASGQKNTAICAAIRKWKEWSPDLVHVNKQNLEDGLDLLAAVDSLKVPSICTIHLTQKASSLRAVLGCLRDWNACHALKRHRHVYVTVHASRAEELQKFLGPDGRVSVIRNGVEIPDKSSFKATRESKRRELGISGEPLLVLGVGRFVEQKRPLLFLRHAARIKQARPDARFLWLGGENEGNFGWVGRRTRFGQPQLSRQWEELKVELNLQDCVRQLPWQSDLEPFWAAGDLYLHTAAYEGLPFSLLEAMAAGLPVAVSAELRKDMDFLNEENSIVLAGVPEQGMWNISDEILRCIGASGGNLIEREFSIRRMAQEYEELYSRIKENCSNV